MLRSDMAGWQWGPGRGRGWSEKMKTNPGCGLVRLGQGAPARLWGGEPGQSQTWATEGTC